MDIKKIEQDIEAACTGSCFGKGVAFKVKLGGACPNPGDPQLLAHVRDAAKAKAYTQSQQHCEGEFCECYGTYHAIIPEQCVTLKDAQGQDVCLYFASYAYIGECAIIV